MYICPELRLSPPAAAEPRLQLQKEIPFSASSPPAHPGNTGISPGFSSRRSSPTPTACSPSPDDLHTDTTAQRGAWGATGSTTFPASPLSCPMEAPRLKQERGQLETQRGPSRSLSATVIHPAPRPRPFSAKCSQPSSPGLAPLRSLQNCCPASTPTATSRPVVLREEHGIQAVCRHVWLSHLERGALAPNGWRGQGRC